MSEHNNKQQQHRDHAGKNGIDTGEAVGTVGGAAAGAALGSFLGPVGTLAGGVAGAALGNKAGEGMGNNDKQSGHGESSRSSSGQE
ncbi:glycine zipper domain-containing protein [Paenibacillus chitinolyticus]|uniref:glycine zipper domain-containing protein n=1 Tax=Paenibacillus chitinolyticus TaxID=79263 RepID=UPI0036676191